MDFTQRPQRENHAKNAKKFKTVLREMRVFSAGNSSVGSARDGFHAKTAKGKSRKEREEV